MDPVVSYMTSMIVGAGAIAVEGIPLTRLGMEHVSVCHHFHHRKNVKKIVNARMMWIVGLTTICKTVIAGNFNHT